MWLIINVQDGARGLRVNVMSSSFCNSEIKGTMQIMAPSDTENHARLSQWGILFGFVFSFWTGPFGRTSSISCFTCLYLGEIDRDLLLSSYLIFLSLPFLTLKTKRTSLFFLNVLTLLPQCFTCQIALSQKFHAVVATLYSSIFSSTCCNSVGFPKSPMESNNGSPKTAASQNAEAVSEELSDLCIISLKSKGLLCFPG